MRVFSAILWGLLAFVGGGQTVSANTNLTGAIAAVNGQDYATARSLQVQLSDPAARDVIEWMLLRARQGTFSEAEDFLERNADWPGLPLLRRRQEAVMDGSISPERIVAFFQGQAPKTPAGAFLYAEALMKIGQRTAGQAEAIRAWREMPMSEAQERQFLTQYGSTLSDYHVERLDAMLWAGETEAAVRLYERVPVGWQNLAKARLALRAESTGVDALINAVPESLSSDPGLAYERFRWRLSKGRRAAALELMLARSTSAEALGRPDIWAKRRRALSRDLMEAGQHRQAYEIAANHHLGSREDAAQLEWFAGFVALRKMNDPQLAIARFKAFDEGVTSPISKGRAGYWLGRAYEAAGDDVQARAFYEFGAGYQTSFYGQLAAERIGAAPDPRLAGGEVFADWQTASFRNSSVLRAALLLHAAGEKNLAERFMTHLAESLTREEIGQLIDIALEMKEPHIAVMIGKRAAQAGHELHKGYFAVMPGLEQIAGSVPPELVLSIARRESEFDPVVISPAGARGLMQLMPGTAQDMAAVTGQGYSASRLLSDPTYNAQLGTAYLAEMTKQFGNSSVLLTIAYNAGPRRVGQWIERLGDPRSANVDVVDWIEQVPFRETRNYIMRVSEGLAIYRARLAGEAQPLRLEETLKRR